MNYRSQRDRLLFNFFFQKDWIVIDPICTFIFSVLVLITTFAIIKDAVMVLMEAIPKGIDFEEMMNILLMIEGVERVHNLRIWALSLDKVAMSAHVAISKLMRIYKYFTLNHT